MWLLDDIMDWIYLNINPSKEKEEYILRKKLGDKYIDWRDFVPARYGGKIPSSQLEGTIWEDPIMREARSYRYYYSDISKRDK